MFGKKFKTYYFYNKKKIDGLINYAKKNNSILVSTLKDEQRVNFNQRKKIFFLDLEIEIKEEKSLINFLKKKNCIN